MIDHNQRITLKRKKEELINKIFNHAEPFIIAIIIVISVVVMSLSWDTYDDYRDNSDIFVQCLNGAVIDTGEGVITCKVGKGLVK